MDVNHETHTHIYSTPKSAINFLKEHYHHFNSSPEVQQLEILDHWQRRHIGWFLFFQMRTRIAARRKLEPAEAGAVVVKCVTAARTSTSGSSWRSCFRARASTVPVYAGWTVARVCSRSRTRSAWPGCGANERIGRQWTTTSWAVASGNITRKGSWRRRSVARGWSISSAILTACKLPGSR